MNLVGIDPGQRHTGLCLLTEAGPVFHEIRTGEEDVLTSLRTIRAELISWRMTHSLHAGNTTFAMEKQLSVGGQSSSLMFAVQMTILDVITPSDGIKIVSPLPIQLVSYLKKVHNIDTTSASSIVKSFQTQLNWKKRISQHCVDAYYLARLAQDVLAGKWEYKLPSNEQKLFPGTTLNGKQC